MNYNGTCSMPDGKTFSITKPFRITCETTRRHHSVSSAETTLRITGIDWHSSKEWLIKVLKYQNTIVEFALFLLVTRDTNIGYTLIPKIILESLINAWFGNIAFDYKNYYFISLNRVNLNCVLFVFYLLLRQNIIHYIILNTY